MKKILFLLFGLFTVTAYAQEAEALKEYFLKTLQGEDATPPSEKVLIKKIDKTRAEVWEAWKEANEAFEEDRLPELDSLSRAPFGSWPLPENLEPNAVMPFYYGCKGDKPQEGYPLFIYLHGSGDKEHEWANGLTFGNRFADSPSVYFIPQIPNEGEWYRWWQQSKQYAWDRLLRQTLLKDYINPNKLYVFGISEGGYGSQRLASYYADYWAAAGPMAGGEPLKNAPAENLMHTPFLLRTGAEDKGFYRDILSRYTRDALDSLVNLNPIGFRHRVDLIPGMGHHIDYDVTTPWLNHFTRTMNPKEFIWEDFEMDGVHRKGFYNLLVDQRPDSLLRTRYDFIIGDSNVVNIIIEDVHYQTIQKDAQFGIEMKFERTYTPAEGGKLTVFLDEDMVDLTSWVKIRINGRQLFFGKLRPNVKDMAKSLATFYDPERIFPVSVEIEY